MQQITQEVRQFVVDNFVFENNRHLADDDSFLETGLIDSMGILTLIEFVKDKYAIAIEDEDVVPENWDSVRRIATFVGDRLNKSGVSPAIGVSCDQR